MNHLLNKNIIIGITGGIAAYKSAELCRLLIKQGANVRVVMTEAAQEFIQPLTFQALSGEPVYTDLFAADASHAMDHIELARWADLLLIAPATANAIAKLANGYADNLLLTIVLATENRLAIAPTMNQKMHKNPATDQNIKILLDRGFLIWGPDEGEQACGETGPGRMLEPEDLLRRCEQSFWPGQLSGKKVLITAGPTREAIDPVRFLSNHSSGKMGYALAQAAVDEGADVTLVSGPVCLQAPQSVAVVQCQSAEDMYQQVMSHIKEQDIFIANAAVADYRLDTIAVQKIKKSTEKMTLNLVKNPDILSAVASLDIKPFCVGFAAETQDLEHNARHKLASKNLDIIAANRVDGAETGFDVDDNALSIFWPGGSQRLPRQSKNLIAQQLIAIIAEKYQLSLHMNYAEDST